MSRVPIKRTSQEINNWGFDEDYNKPYVEILVENEAETALVRQKPIATEAKQDNIITELQSLTGFEIPAYDYIVLTYITSGNGTGEIGTVTFKTGGGAGVIVAVLTLVYDAPNELTSVAKT